MYIFISHVAEFGGAEKVLLNLAKAISKDEAIKFFAPIGGLADKAQDNGIDVTSIPYVAKKDNKFFFWHIINILKLNMMIIFSSKKRDVIVLNAPRALIYLLPILFFLRNKKVCFAHDVVLNKSLTKIIVFFTKVFTRVRMLPVSNAIADSLLLSRNSVLHNPVFTSKGEDCVGRFKKHEIRMGMVSNIAEWKGHIFALNALSGLLEGDDAITYEIYGNIMDEKERGYLTCLVARINEIPGVEYKGYTTDPCRVYQSLDVVVQSSLKSEQPLTLAEAISAGCLIVSPSGGGEEEVIKKWPAVRWYKRSDATSLLEAVKDSISVIRANGVAVTKEDYKLWLNGNTVKDWVGKFKSIIGSRI